MQPPVPNPWLHRFAVLTTLATLALIAVGGLVTSHGVGMAVPDWPNTYGYNMFFFPISRWVGGIFYEHTHRLAASVVGLMTTILALWLYGRNARTMLRWGGPVLVGLGIASLASGRAGDAIVTAAAGLAAFGASWVWPRCEASPKWLRRLGLAAFLAVALQGVLGGLRVVLFKDQLGILHATLAQLFFALTCALALFTSKWWKSRAPESGRLGGLRLLLPATTLLLLCQLILGATMRHQHAGLSISDFPLAYGKLWPATDPASIAQYNQRRLEITALNPITASQIYLQMFHRLAAGLILVAVTLCAWSARRRLGPADTLSRWTLAWLGLILLQVLLGAATIWSNKAADIATAHVLIGALSLATGAVLTILTRRAWAYTAEPNLASSAAATLFPRGPAPAAGYK